MVILRGVVEVKFTKYCSCAAENPGELKHKFQEWTDFSIILELEPYMLETCSFREYNHFRMSKFMSMSCLLEDIESILLIVHLCVWIDIDPISPNCNLMFADRS